MFCGDGTCDHTQASAGVYADESGPEMARGLAALSAEPAWPLTCTYSSSGEGQGGVVSAIVPDDAGDATHGVINTRSRKKMPHFMTALICFRSIYVLERNRAHCISN
jgi:uncharacterized membrane protein (UPF0136 family)